MPTNSPKPDGLTVEVRLTPAERAILHRLEERLKLLEDRLSRLIEMRLANLRQAVEAELMATEIEDSEADEDDDDDESEP